MSKKMQNIEYINKEKNGKFKRRNKQKIRKLEKQEKEIDSNEEIKTINSKIVIEIIKK